MTESPSGAEGELKVPALDLCDGFHDNVLHDEEDGSRRGRNMIKDKTGALWRDKCLQPWRLLKALFYVRGGFFWCHW